MNESFTINNFEDFDNAISTTNKMNSNIADAKKTATEVKSQIDNDAVFMGPCADSCVAMIESLNSELSTISENFTTIGDYFSKVSSAYKSGDTSAMNLVLNLDSSSKKLSVQKMTSMLSSSSGSTQATSFNELGDRAYNGDTDAQKQWIDMVAAIVSTSQFKKYGLKNSLIIAQIINESGWMHTPKTRNSDGSTLTGNNNVLGINTDMGIDVNKQSSAWSKKRKSTQSNVTQWNSSGQVIGTSEAMRTYDSVEECIEDYADILSTYHPECKGSNNLEDYRSFLEGYTPNPNASTTDKYRNIIDKYGLEKYDEVFV